MADQAPSFQFEDIPIEEARKIGRGPRMDPEIYHALKENIQSLDNTASRMSLPDGTSPTTMKNRILRVAAEPNIPHSIGFSGGVWHGSLKASRGEELEIEQPVSSR